MEKGLLYSNEQDAAKAFNGQSGIFDEIYSKNAIIQYKRQRVRKHVLEYLKPDSQILELNSGTGEDAIWFAKQGCRVHATDISTGMMDVLVRKVKASGLERSISNELCSFTELTSIRQKGPYDIIFSNFAGLNCTGELKKTLRSFEYLLKPGGMVTLILLPPFCLWEFLLLFKGKFKTACRRLFSGHGVQAYVEGNPFTCWYYHPDYIISELKNSFEVYGLEGLCTIIPPSYILGFPEKYPTFYSFLERWEERLKKRRPWKSIGDYYILSLKKKI